MSIHKASINEKTNKARLLETMILIRETETRMQELFLQNLVRGTTHLCIGQEACSTGVAAAMEEGDTLTCTYRGHGYALAMGMSVNALVGEMLGKTSGCCGGMGGSMHMTDASIGLLGANAIVGAQIPIAVGAALTAQIRNQGNVAFTIMGDGATNIGAFHESMNMAAAWKLPVVFVCENNLYGEYSAIARTTGVTDLAVRGAAYGMPGEIVDGQDLEAVRDVVRSARDRASRGSGPTFLELKTYRYSGHSRTDQGPYRPAGELEAWRARDPIRILAERMTEAGEISAEEFQSLEDAAAEALRLAIDAAKEAPFPGVESLDTHIYYQRNAYGQEAE